MSKDVNIGYIKISDEVIMIVAANAANNTPGVYALSGGFIDNLKNIRGNETQKKGVKLDRDDNECTIDIHIITEFDVKIPQVAWDVQVKVKDEVESMTGIDVKAVNIHVQGVHIIDEEESEFND